MLTFFRKTKLILCTFAMLVSSSVWAAFMKNVPQKLIQPNGIVVNAFASGDEYYNWVHDAEGYTIVKNTKNNYYVYAAKSAGKLVATSYVAGQTSPASVGLTPNLLDDASVISSSVKTKRASRNAQKNSYRSAAGSNLSVRPAVGLYNNVVVYIQFSDQTTSTLTRATSESIFNGTGVVSVKDFYNEVSGGQLNVTSTFFPNTSNTYPVYYQDSHPRSYYLADTPDGYNNTLPSSTDREHTLLKNAIDAIASQVPASLVIDGNNDGFVDNVTFVFNGQQANWSDLLWPHRWSLFSQTAYINSKQVYDYNTCFSESMGAGVISHEMFHSFSAPDLYSYSAWTSVTATGDWDLMSSGDWTTPRHMNVYMKSRYGTWTTIPEITTTGTYTLQSVATSPFSAFKIKFPNTTTNEYLVVEYRKKTGLYETALGGDEGMLLYRVNENGSNAGGPDHEVYVYRPDGTNTVDGNLYNATLNNTLGRTSFNDATNPADFLSNNQLGGLLANAGISDVVLNGNTLTFKFTGASVSACTDPAWNATTAYSGGDKVSYNNIVYTANWWTQGNQPDLNSGPAGSGKPWTQTGTCGSANSAPVVTFTAPAKNSIFNVGVNVTLKAEAIDSDGTISKVEFLNASDAVIFTDNSAPFEYTLTGLSTGSYVYKVRAYDNQNQASDLAYNNFDVRDPAPSITITAPTEGQVLTLPAGGKINVTVSTSPALVDSVKYIIVDVVCNGPGCANVRRIVTTTAPYAVSYDPIAGAVSSQVNAIAFKNGIGSTGAVVNYTVVQPTKPVVTITSPTEGQISYLYPSDGTLTTVNLSFNVALSAIDSVRYTVVETFCDGPGCANVRRFSVKNSPFSLSFLSSLRSTGYTQVEVVAFSKGIASDAASRVFYVKPLPELTFVSPLNNTNVSKNIATLPIDVTVNSSQIAIDSVVYTVYDTKITGTTGVTTTRKFVKTAPFDFILPVIGGNTFTKIFALAYGDNGKFSKSQQIQVNYNEVPTVFITDPVSTFKFNVGGSVTIKASARDVDGTIAKVEIYSPHIPNSKVTLTTPPFQATFNNLESSGLRGATSFVVVATDNEGGVSGASIDVLENRLPVVTITAPVAVGGINPTYVVGGSVTVSANVTDNDGTITKVEFTQGNTGTGLVTKTAAPYTARFTNLPAPNPDGSYSFTVKAYDNNGGITTKLVVVYRNRIPTIWITSPTPDASIPSGTSVTITSVVNDPDFISGKVEYFNGAVKLGETIYNSTFTTPTISFNAGTLAVGTYALTAKITDDKGQTGVSGVVNFTVTGVATCTDPEWNAATSYWAGTIVSRLGKRYKANYWSQNAAPETHSAAYQEWILLGNCGTRFAAASAGNILTVYPNPIVADATIAIDLASDDHVSIDLLSLYGVQVATVFSGKLETGTHSFHLNTQNLAAGVYVVRVSGGSISEKVTIIKN